jgi:alkylation response protein AidB-like acyl-CoA dehydrogenase
VLARSEGGTRVPSLDGTGTTSAQPVGGDPVADADARLRAWSAATLGYLAGLAAASLSSTVSYVSSREQFGAPLSALPTMQARLADASLAADGLELVAWEAAVAGLDADALPREALAWAGAAAREVTATAHQAHGGIGFALESGVHRPFRRAKTVQVWTAAVLAAVP